jgi:sugar phosphate isomerase/epimerase
MKLVRILPRRMTLILVYGLMISCNPGTKQDGRKGSSIGKKHPIGTNGSDFKISLAQWSLHRTFYGSEIQDWSKFEEILQENPDALIQGEDPMKFPEMAAGYGIHCIELVNTFYLSKVNDEAYWTLFKKKCEDSGVMVGLIMCDLPGNLGDADPEALKATVERHYPWIDIAKFLGAHSIRVNAAGEGTPEEVADNVTKGLRMLGEYGALKGINIIVENHGGYSSSGKWLSDVIEAVELENVGTLPDFGNFCIERGPDGCIEEYDRYTGMEELMPYAKGVSAKSSEFDREGNERNTDFLRAMRIVKASGFKGYVGIEYEGAKLSEDKGIKMTKVLLEKVFAAL